jgi:hypothetical protein
MAVLVEAVGVEITELLVLAVMAASMVEEEEVGLVVQLPMHQVWEDQAQ